MQNLITITRHAEKELQGQVTGANKTALRVAEERIFEFNQLIQ